VPAPPAEPGRCPSRRGGRAGPGHVVGPTRTGSAPSRRKLLAYARNLLNSDYAGHRLTFQLFAQSPPFAHLGAVYRNFDWDGPLDLVKDAAGLSDQVLGSVTRRPAAAPPATAAYVSTGATATPSPPSTPCGAATSRRKYAYVQRALDPAASPGYGVPGDARPA
jgi:hypothetical protein